MRCDFLLVCALLIGVANSRSVRVAREATTTTEPNIMCTIPICEGVGCRINYDEYPCPGCICDEGSTRVRREATTEPNVQCTLPNCEAVGCRINYDQLPCPGCVCDEGSARVAREAPAVPDVQCSLPNCEAIGCTINYDHLPCPACDCGEGSARVAREAPAGSARVAKEAPPEPEVQCAPVKCDPSCHEGIGQYNCPVCICGPACSPPKCDPGCRIHYEESLGPCPGCVCDDKEDEAESQNISAFALPHGAPLKKCECDWRYFKHYATKKCSPVLEEGCDCPVRFDCPEAEKIETNVCEYKGRTYEVGEDIKTPNSCEICSCADGYGGGTEISCIPIECPSVFRPPPDEGCYEVFEEDKCCSVDMKCVDPEDQNQENITEPTCEYNGKIYRKGERIYPEEDHCMSCLCDENWDGVNVERCHIHECLLERRLGDLKRGCIPIYHEKTCCPIEFHCGSGGEQNLNDTDLAPKSEGGCTFEGKSYSIGEELDIHHPTNCVTCTCKTPPDFTCIHISCSGPPKGDYENCRSVYHEGSCCPTYDCLSRSESYACEPVTCKNGCEELIGPNGCGLCQCNNVLCAPPKCPDACEIDYDVTNGTCPRCKCPVTVQMGPIQCAAVICDSNCFEAVGSNGCLTCLCGPLCSPPKCDDGCSVQKDVPIGQCPGCVCPSSPEQGVLDGQVQCAPVKCGPLCREALGQFGCPTCFCYPMCSPPQCDPGCEIETVPSSGPCPGCVCTDQPTHNIQCAPVKCAPTCREEIGEHGCPICQCDPLCSPPKCDPGCEVELVPSSGPCPGCVCKLKISEVQCAPVKCDDPTCREVTGESGCPMCICGPLCSPPRCDPGCEVETVPSSGPCPGCICREQKLPEIQCAPVKCDDDPTCRQVTGESGCPTCVCGPLCSPPKCDVGCRVETVPSSGPCPGCVCDDNAEAQVLCAPVKCGPLCREGVGQFGCPMCLCDPACSPPKCDPGCREEVVPSLGPCPGCVCDDIKDST